MDTREAFLKKHWIAYQAIPQEVALQLRSPEQSRYLWGRVLFLSKTKISLDQNQISENKKRDVLLDGYSLQKDYFPSLLNIGDLVLIDRTEKNIELLVPSNGKFKLKGFDLETSKKWMNFLGLVREFFNKENFIEVRTPTLVNSPGVENHIDFFDTAYRFGNFNQKYYLPTSPEFQLKKMLVSGWTDIFEFKESFRNEEYGPYHQPEFIMLEWYRAYANLDFIVKDCEKLFSFLGNKILEKEVLLKKISVKELFQQTCNFELSSTSSKQELIDLLKSLKIDFHLNDSWEDLFFRLMIHKIEPYLKKQGPCIVYNFPSQLAAFSKINTEGYAERFEIYWNGIELANAYHELNDVVEQEKRFTKINQYREKNKKSLCPIDEEYLLALDYGMPPSGGIAMGLERLFMSFYNISDIEQVRAFSHCPQA